jgi:hypothetical protein
MIVKEGSIIAAVVIVVALVAAYGPADAPAT